jgi:hypothetical protein
MTLKFRMCASFRTFSRLFFSCFGLAMFLQNFAGIGGNPALLAFSAIQALRTLAKDIFAG